MNELMKEIFIKFADITGISDQVGPVLSIGGILVIVLGMIGCILGFRTYRMFFSALLFVVVAMASFWILEGEALRSIATCVAVVGVVLAFFGYRWPKLGGFTICFVIGMCFGWIIHPSLILAIIVGVLAALFELYFPVLAISGMTSLWGASLLVGKLEFDGVIEIVVIMLITIGSTIFQLVINRKQKLFSKVCPDKIRYRMEQRGK